MTASTRLSTALGDRYRIERELGAGGMATVYLARDLKHDRDVALKVLRPELTAVLGAERFLNEVRITAQLDHPHILTLIDSGADDTLLWYVLPYVRGESLRERLTREKQLGVEEALAITRQVAGALDYANRQGVVHRDIKPENILIQEGEAMLADFGIALAVKEAGGRRLTETGLSLGTPQYMSPEQATGDRQLDARSDVYSLGAVLYEMLAGEPPVTGPTAQAMIAKLMAERPTPLRVLRDTVPAVIANAVAKALAKVPADRFASAAEFAAALSEPAPAPTARRWTPSRRGLTSALGAVAVLVLAATLVRWRLSPAPASFTHEQLTFSGTATAPSLSPDGGFVAYLERNAGNTSGGSLMVRDLASHRTVELLSDSLRLWYPGWSPDGRAMLVPATIPGNRRELGLYSIPRLGGDARLLLRLPGGSLPRWAFTRDGRRIAISHGRTVIIAAVADDGALAPRDSFVVGGASEVFVSAWSLGADWLLCHVFQPNNTIANTVVRPNGTTLAVIEGVDRPAGLSSDGRSLIYMRSSGAISELVQVPFDPLSGQIEGEPVPLLPGVPMRFFDRSRDGGTILYTREIVSSNLRLFERAGNRDLTTGTAYYAYPVFSPDGRTIAFGRWGGAGYDVFVMPAAGGAHRQVTFAVRVARDVAWSPDGNRLAFGMVTDSGVVPVVADVAGGAPRAIGRRKAGHGGTHGQYAFSPDGRRLLYQVEGIGNFAIVDLETGTEALLFPGDSGGAEFQHLVFSPDGSRVAVAKTAGSERGLWIVELETGVGARLSEGPRLRPLRWQRDGTVYYLEGTEIRSVSPRGGRPRTMATLPPGCEYATMSADLHRFACQEERRQEDVWIARLP